VKTLRLGAKGKLFSDSCKLLLFHRLPFRSSLIFIFHLFPSNRNTRSRQPAFLEFDQEYSVFSDFIDNGGEKVKTLVKALKAVTSIAPVSGLLQSSIERTIDKHMVSDENAHHWDNASAWKTLLRQGSLFEIFSLADNVKKNTTTTHLELVGNVIAAMDDVKHFILRHEIHVLFSALKLPLSGGLTRLRFNPVAMSFQKFVEYAKDSKLFASVFKATWLRCVSQDHTAFASSRSLKDAILKEADKAPALRQFEIQFGNHFNKARI
jgi:hypothetical protein